MRLVAATTQGAARVAARMRKQDRLEVMSSHFQTPSEAIANSWRASHVCHGVESTDGRAVGMCGLNGHTIWLLAADDIFSDPLDRRRFARESRRWVDSLLVDHGVPLLENWALSSNHSTLRWLRFLGFEIDPPRPMGPYLRMFSHFWRVP